MADDNPPDGWAGKPMKYMRYAIGEIIFVVLIPTENDNLYLIMQILTT